MTRLRDFRRRTRSKLAMVLTAVFVLTGCSEFSGIYDIPMPGGADIGTDPIEMKVQFRNVLDLVPQTHVKLNEVAVGRVEDVGLAPDSWHAEVKILLNRDVDLPANALANIKMSSLLGEKYVELVAPPQGSEEGKLDDGAVIPVSRTNRNTEVEEVLGALSMLLNGGGIEQLSTIDKELNNVFKGAGGTRELKTLLRNADKLVKSLDGQRGNISKALDGVNTLGKTLDKEKVKISKALDELPQGMKVLDRQRKDIVKALKALGGLGKVTSETLNKSKKDLIENLQSLKPILQAVIDSGGDLPKALEIMFSFPLNDSSAEAVRGDYINLDLKLDANVQEIIDAYNRGGQHPLPDVPVVGDLPLDQAPPLPLDNLGTVDDLLDGLTGGGS